MVISEDVLREIKAKLKQYEAMKEGTIARIEKNIDDAVKKLYSTKNELINEVEREFKVNSFADFLSNKDKHTDEDARMFLNEQTIPENFGPDENSLSTLLKDIDSFRAWRDKPRPLDLVSKDLEAKNVTYDSISLSWTAVNSDCVYEIELRSSTSMKITHYTDKLEHAFYNLRPGREYYIRVRAVFLRKGMKCMWSDPITVKTKNIFVRDVVVKAASWCEMEVSWEVYDEEEESNNDIRYTVEMRKEGERHWNEVKSGLVDKTSRVGGLMDDSAYEVRVRCVVKGGSLVSKWSGVVKGRTQKIPVPSGITAKGTAWDSIALTWVNIAGISYEIERGFLPETEHSFRVRTVRGNSVSKWSGVVKGRTLKAPVPSNITANGTAWDSIALTWVNIAGMSYEIEVDGSNFLDTSSADRFTKRGFLPETEHSFRVRTVSGNSVSEWSGVVKGRTMKWDCMWKECPGYIDKDRKYIVDKGNPRVATKTNSNGYCTIIGDAQIPLNAVTSWSIKILKSKNNNGSGINIGVAPNDINQNAVNYEICGWYFSCYRSTLCSGPPHNYRYKVCGPRKGAGQCVHTGDSVGVVMNTTKGELSFVLNGVNLGVAYEGIPLDKPLVPCAIILYQGDSVELDLSGVKENVDSTISLPSNITTKNGVTWDSITLTWDEVADASFYQVKVDGSKSWDTATTNTFTKRGLLPDTDHTFRVRTVKKNSVSKWGNPVKGKTLKESFRTSGWKECPDNIDWERKYSVDEENPRVATKVNGDCYCAIIGNTFVPFYAVTSWSIKVLKSKNNDGSGILIGVAPSDINQNDNSNYNRCGWYFNCDDSTLCYSPPHNYRGKKYGPRKWFTCYVHTGDSVGVVMNTTRGELSFVLNGVNLGVAYEGIPLDKPLVPCVLLKNDGDSVELDTSGVKEPSKDLCGALIKLSFFFFLLAGALSIISRRQERRW